MAEEIRRKNREGSIDRLVEPEEMVPAASWVVSRDADKVNGMRYDAKQWDASLPPAEAAAPLRPPGGLRAARAGGTAGGPILALALAPAPQ